MSTKDYFDKGFSLKHLKNKSQDDIREDLESPRYVDAYVKRRDRYFPSVDFATASNFANFGSAELYYTQAIERIYKTYPYDGSRAEKLEWENDSNYIDVFIYDNEYPRSNGYVVINPTVSSYTTINANVGNHYIYSSSAPEYILIKGGPHADPSGDTKSPPAAGQKQQGTSKANIYNAASQRTNNLELDPNKGITVEYWCKKDGWAETGANSTYEVFFHAGNTGSVNDEYGNLLTFAKGASPGNVYMTYTSGSTTIAATHDTGLSNIADGNWHHHALAMKKISGKSIRFDGVDDFATLGRPASIEFDPDGDSFAISCWVKTKHSGSIIGVASTNTQGVEGSYYRMFIQGDGKLVGRIGNSGNSAFSDAAINDGNWHHCALVVDNTGAVLGGVGNKLYVDGVVQANGGSNANFTAPGIDLLIGARRDGSNSKNTFHFKGHIDEVTMWSVALSATEVSELYNSGAYFSPKDHSKVANLVSWWEMGDGATASQVGTLLDSHGTNTGQLLNTKSPCGVVSHSKFEDYVQSELYLDGEHKSTVAIGASSIGAVGGTMLGSIGALSTELSASAAVGTTVTNISAGLFAGAGWGNIVSASFDEFRFWKTRRDAQQISRYYNDQIGGGTNTDNIKYDDTDYLVDLGVYYKFNEGIVGNSSIDQTVLDYSGRISNGTFVNYKSSGTLQSRNTGSAIVLSKAATKEFKDPVVYSSHPDVAALLNSKKVSGSVHDYQNITSLYRTLPSWISEADETQSGHLKHLTQIMASYFDEAFLQIQSLPKLKDINYPYDNNYEKALPFADRLLNTRGLDAPELFADASALAKYLDRDEKILFEKKLSEIKNTIYQNIYNNLTYIQKSKGTTKSIRNLLRCFGVDEELIRINVYPKNDTYEYKDNVLHTSLRKKYVDFDDPETRMNTELGYSGAYKATVYQYYDPAETNSLSYIPALSMDVTNAPDHSGLAATLEAEVIFPKRTIKGDLNNDVFESDVVSLFGLHLVGASNTDLTWAGDDSTHFKVEAVKSANDKRSVRFRLSGGTDVTTLSTTSSFKSVYNNEKWNFAVRIKPEIYPLSDKVVSPTKTGYVIELYGVNYISDILQEEFTLSGVLTEAAAIKFFESAKRVFVGAHRVNFNGDVITPSDVKISSVRMWYDYLENDVIKAHARNAANGGRLHPYKNTLFAAGSKGDLDTGTVGNQTLFDVRIPEIETLLLHWDFTNVTGSDASGQFSVDDLSSGSASDRAQGRYGVFSNVNSYMYPARGDHFTVSTQDAVDVEFVATAKQRLPEVSNSDDMVKILNQQDDIVFTRDTTYIQHIISIEKSMYQIISDQMVNMFGTVVGFNNLIGDPVNRYRPSYKQLEKLRNIFFEGVENEPDLDKFVEYFKWIDDSVTFFILQLIPASANKVEFLRNMVENHILERNKHFYKFPTIEMDTPEPFDQFKGINELLYNWKFGHAPINPNPTSNQDQNCLWWKERAERSGVLTSGDANVDANKEIILKTTITEVSGNDTLTLSYGANPNKTKYSASYFYDRALSQPYHLDSEYAKVYKAGSNPDAQQKPDFYKNIVKFGSDNDFLWLDRDNQLRSQICADEITPNLWPKNKKERVVKALTMTAEDIASSNADGTGKDDYKITDDKSTRLLPFNMYSSSLAESQAKSPDYNSDYDSYFSSSTEFTNYHHDVYYPSYEVPMQGPFARQHVGGNQHRHISLNAYKTTAGDAPGTETDFYDNRMTRPEAWDLVIENSNTLHSSGNKVHVLAIPFSSGKNMPPEMSGSSPPNAGTVANEPANPSNDDPSPEDRFTDLSTGIFKDQGQGAEITGSQSGWDINFSGESSDNSGPSGAYGGSHYAVARPQPGLDDAGRIFGLRTPMVDLLDADFTEGGLDQAYLEFRYHMYTTMLSHGQLSIQYSYDADFSDGGNYLTTIWDYGGADTSTIFINGQTVADAHTSPWKLARVSLASLVKTRFFIRFVYFSPMHHAADCALDDINVVIPTSQTTSDPYGSIRLLHPTHDDHNRPHAIFTREEYAKRPVNIKNIQVGHLTPAHIAGNHTGQPIASVISPLEFNPDDSHQTVLPATKAGNYYNRYECVNTFSREVNDPYFVKKEGNIYESPGDADASMEPSGTFQQEIASMYMTFRDSSGEFANWGAQFSFGTEARLGGNPGPRGKNYKLPDRTDLDTWKYRILVGSDVVQYQKNKTRFINRFSSPGDILDRSRGFFTTPHEVFAAHNALPWRNYHVLKHHKSMLTAHCGKFGASAHKQQALDQVLTNAAGNNISGSSAIARITIKDAALLPTTNATHLTICDAGGNVATFKFTSGANDTTTTPYSVNVVTNNTATTIANLATVIQFAFSTGSTHGQAGYYDEYLKKNSKQFTIDTLTYSDSNSNGTNDQLLLMQGIPGMVGNQRIVSAVSSSALVVSGFYGGKNASARVYETNFLGDSSGDRRGTIHKDDYSITSGSASNSSDAVHRAAMHKRHRNRGDKLISGKNVNPSAVSANATGANVALGSQYDNEYVSHTIPRENDQVRWVRRVKQLDQNYFEQLDPSGDTYKSIEDLLKEGTPVGYLEVDQHGTEVGS